MNNISIKELFKQAQNGDKEARDYLITSNIKLVYMIAHKYRERNIDFDTAVQEGSVGLIKAVDKFEVDRGLKFSTYATFIIAGEIQRYIRDLQENRPFRPRRREYELYKKICRARRVLSQEFQNEPKAYEIAIYLREDISEVEMLINALENSKSMYSMKYRNDEREKDDILLIDSILDEDTLEDQVLNKISINAALDQLTEKQKKVIQLRYFQDYSQTETGQALNISQAQISRIEKKALKLLKEVI